MPLDGITAKALAAELSRSLSQARVDKIFQPERCDIVLSLRGKDESFRLLLSANPSSPRLHLITENRKNPPQPPMFCMLLRKHLIGARLLELHTPQYERIFILRFQTINELGDKLEKRLIVELMGRHSNIILVNEQDRIHDSILHVDDSISRVREVMPARPYAFPPAQGKLLPRDILAHIDRGEDFWGPSAVRLPLEKALLSRLQGFSPQLCHELAFRAALDGRCKVDALSEAEQGRLRRVLLDLMQKITAEAFRPTTFYERPEATIPLDFHALDLQSFAYRRSENSICAAMERYYLQRMIENTFRQKKNHLQRLIQQQVKHVQKKLQIHEKDQAEGKKRDRYRRHGELILAHVHKIREGDKHLIATDFYDEDQKDVKIPLDPSRSGPQNAQRYFKRYDKAKTRAETGARLAREDRKELQYLETLRRALENAAELDDLAALSQEMRQAGLSRKNIIRQEKELQENAGPDLSGGQKPGKRGKGKRAPGPKKKARAKNEKPLPPRKYLSSDGLPIWVGRNNLQNDQLTLKTAQKDDLWLHVQKMPGTHVIVRCGKQEVPEQTLLEAAQTAAWFSRASGDGQPEAGSGHKVPVDYCPVRHVKKPAGSKPGMVIYEGYQTVQVTPQDPSILLKSDP